MQTSVMWSFRIWNRRVSTVGVCGLTCLGGALIKASDINSDSEWSSLNNIGVIKLDHRYKGFPIISCGSLTVCLYHLIETKMGPNVASLPTAADNQIVTDGAETAETSSSLNEQFLHFRRGWFVQVVAVSSRLSSHFHRQAWSRGRVASENTSWFI